MNKNILPSQTTEKDPAVGISFKVPGSEVAQCSGGPDNDQYPDDVDEEKEDDDSKEFDRNGNGDDNKDGVVVDKNNNGNITSFAHSFNIKREENEGKSHL